MNNSSAAPPPLPPRRPPRPRIPSRCLSVLFLFLPPLPCIRARLCDAGHACGSCLHLLPDLSCTTPLPSCGRPGLEAGWKCAGRGLCGTLGDAAQCRAYSVSDTPSEGEILTEVFTS